jgi:hypothetical protein
MCRFLIFFGLTASVLAAFGSPANAQTPPPSTSVQIINATSVPAIALDINDSLAYEDFPQGLETADSPAGALRATYEAEDKATGLRARSPAIIYEPDTNQSLVILGDFSTDTPPGMLRHPGRALIGENKRHPPNVLFQVFPHTAAEAPLRLRIINGMPGKNLTFVAGREELVISPGESAALTSQPAVAQYLAIVDGEKTTLLMRQEGLVRNAMIIFFLKSGKPAFMRAFENTAESNRKREELAKERK